MSFVSLEDKKKKQTTLQCAAQTIHLYEKRYYISLSLIKIYVEQVMRMENCKIFLLFKRSGYHEKRILSFNILTVWN